MQFDKKKFIPAFERALGELHDQQKNGINFLLYKVNSDPRWKYLTDVADFLAIAWYETAATMQPLVETGPRPYFDRYESKTRRGRFLGNTFPGDGYNYRSRGYVPVLGRSAYTRADQLLALSGRLVANPGLAKTPEYAYRIASTGFFDGIMCHNLSSVIRESGGFFFGARRALGGIAAAGRITETARKIRVALRETISFSLDPSLINPDDFSNRPGTIIRAPFESR
jgi:hypothetical protein